MSNAIRILEVLGQSASPSRIEMDAVITGAGLEDQERDALLEADIPALGALLGARVEMVSIQYPGDGEEEDAPKRDDDQDEPGHKDDEE